MAEYSKTIEAADALDRTVADSARARATAARMRRRRRQRRRAG